MPTRGRSPRRPLPLFGHPHSKKNFLPANEAKGPNGPMSEEPFGPGLPLPFKPGLGAAGTSRPGANRHDQPLPWSSLARAPRRAVRRQRPRPHAESRRERWRHVVERGAAIAASFLLRVLHAEPVAAGGTFGSQTLHRPAGQILHPGASQSSVGPNRGTGNKRPQNQRDCAPGDLVCQENSIQLVGVAFPAGVDADSRNPRGFSSGPCRRRRCWLAEGVEQRRAAPVARSARNCRNQPALLAAARLFPAPQPR
jgi:hypothetical protein